MHKSQCNYEKLRPDRKKYINEYAEGRYIPFELTVLHMLNTFIPSYIETFLKRDGKDYDVNTCRQNL